MDFPSFLSFSSSSEEPDWSFLPEPVLYLILSQLFLLSDMVSFGRVCNRWNSVLKFRLQELKFTSNMSFKKHLPMLLIPTVDSSESSRNLFSLTDAEVYGLKLSVPYNNRCIGSSHGWLIFLDSISFAITLFNPFYFGSSKGTIHLPTFVPAAYARLMAQESHEREFFSDYFICKAILSSDPSSGASGFIVMMIYGDTRSLAFHRSGDASWTYLNNFICGVFDIMYYEGFFLALNFWGEVFECDVRSNLLSLEVATNPVVGPIGVLTRRYIVATDDGNTFLQAVRLMEMLPGTDDSSNLQTYSFLVYKFEALDDSFEWIPVHHIYDGALFVGDNYSTYVSASKCSGLISNAIYFTDDYHDTSTVHNKPYQLMGHRDCGIYLIQEDEFKTHYISCPWQMDMPPPIWMLPTY